MSDLDFQEIPYDTPDPQSEPPDHVNIPISDDEKDNLLESNEPRDEARERVKHSVFSLAFYQQFFNVDTGDVITRIWSSMVPNPRKNYLEYSIRPNPDLYGPFWICATLTFFIAIAGNVGDFFHRSGEGFIWRYDFHKVTLAATVIFAYWLIIPLCISGFLRWRGNKSGFTLTEVLCVYGYSLAIFIPVSIMWLIPVLWVKYLLATIASLLSGCTLLITLWPAVKNDTKKQVALVFMLLVVLLHAGLGTGFVVYFFHYETNISSAATTNPSNPSNNLTIIEGPDQPPQFLIESEDGSPSSPNERQTAMDQNVGQVRSAANPSERSTDLASQNSKNSSNIPNTEITSKLTEMKPSMKYRKKRWT